MEARIRTYPEFAGFCNAPVKPGVAPKVLGYSRTVHRPSHFRHRLFWRANGQSATEFGIVFMLFLMAVMGCINAATWSMETSAADTMAARGAHLASAAIENANYFSYYNSGVHPVDYLGDRQLCAHLSAELSDELLGVKVGAYRDTNTPSLAEPMCNGPFPGGTCPATSNGCQGCPGVAGCVACPSSANTITVTGVYMCVDTPNGITVNGVAYNCAASPPATPKPSCIRVVIAGHGRVIADIGFFPFFTDIPIYSTAVIPTLTYSK